MKNCKDQSQFSISKYYNMRRQSNFNVTTTISSIGYQHAFTVDWVTLKGQFTQK